MWSGLRNTEPARTQVELFAATFQGGCEFDQGNIRLALRAGLEIDWFAMHFLPAPALLVYKGSVAVAWRAYAAAVTVAWRAYDMAMAWAAYPESMAAAWRIYQEAFLLRHPRSPPRGHGRGD